MKENTNARPHAPKAAFNVEEVMDSLGLSRQSVYNEINAGRLRSFKLGRRRLIPADAVPDWVRSMQETQAA